MKRLILLFFILFVSCKDDIKNYVYESGSDQLQMNFKYKLVFSTNGNFILLITTIENAKSFEINNSYLSNNLNSLRLDVVDKFITNEICTTGRTGSYYTSSYCVLLNRF